MPDTILAMLMNPVGTVPKARIIDDLAWLICRGGWPKATVTASDVALDLAYDYLEGVINSDISRADGVSRDAERTRRIIRSLARDLINDIHTMSLFFETMCIRDLRIYAGALGGTVYHYRDKSGLECDAVIHLRNGSYGLVEIKLGGDRNIEAGPESLRTLADRIDSDKMNSPSFKMILTGTAPYAYCRKDGILVVPAGCLKD